MKLFILGGTLTLISWILAWGKFSPLSSYTFFPLWIGYIFTINGLSWGLFKKSLLSQLGKEFVLLFFISVPLWWLFEALNLVTQNWVYLLPSPISSLIYFLGGSINFSIVVPAILSTSFLFYYLLITLKPLKGKPSVVTPTVLIASVVLGTSFLILIFFLPHLYFPLLWGGIFFLLEPINYLLGFPSLFSKISQGDWNLTLAIMVASLFTGVWWELWNYYSYPKWVYSIPELGFFKVFEMPILGYLGYPFFGLEVYALTVFVLGIWNRIVKREKLEII